MIRRTGEFAARELSSTVVSQPAFSPDGLWVAYVDGNQIKKVPAYGGSSLLLAEYLEYRDPWSMLGRERHHPLRIGLWTPGALQPRRRSASCSGRGFDSRLGVSGDAAGWKDRCVHRRRQWGYTSSRGDVARIAPDHGLQTAAAAATRDARGTPAVRDEHR